MQNGIEHEGVIAQARGRQRKQKMREQAEGDTTNNHPEKQDGMRHPRHRIEQSHTLKNKAFNSSSKWSLAHCAPKALICQRHKHATVHEAGASQVQPGPLKQPSPRVAEGTTQSHCTRSGCSGTYLHTY